MKTSLLIFLLPLIFCLTIAADTIPPLPIDALKKIELGYNDTLTKSVSLDTFCLKLYAGNIFGGTLKYTAPIKIRSILSLNVDVNRNFDFSDYLFVNTAIKYGWLSKNFWQDFSLSLIRNTRLQPNRKQYYENIGISYNPIWFIMSSNLNLDNKIRLTRYYDTIPNNFLTNSSNLNINLSTILGTFNYNTDLLFQSFNPEIRRSAYYKTSINFELTDLILIGDYLFFKPGVHYNLGKDRFGTSIMSGVQFNDIKTFLDIKYNSVHHFNWDTLYTNVLPYLVKRESFDYLICDYDVELSLLLNKVEFITRYRQFSSYLFWQLTNSWLQAKVTDTLYQEIGLQVNNRYRSLQNSFCLNYPIRKFFLSPNFHISDSLMFDFNRFMFGASFNFVSSRTLPDYSIFSANLAYQYKLFVLSGHIENIFNNKFEVIPNQYNKGRKYFIGVAINI